MSYKAIYMINLYYDKSEQVYFSSIFRLQEYNPYRSSSWTNRELVNEKRKSRLEIRLIENNKFIMNMTTN